MSRIPLSLLMLLTSYPAWAVIDLKPKIIEVQPGESTAVTIINKSDHMEFVSVALSRLLNPGVPYEDEKLEAVGLSRNPQLYAYPFRLSLAPGQSKKITLKPLAAVEQETVYRLDVKPATAMKGQAEAQIAGGVAVNLSFSALVRQLPQKQTRSIASTCTARGVTLSASGSVRTKVKALTVDGEKRDEFNVYPGTPKEVMGQRISLDGKVLCQGRAQ